MFDSTFIHVPGIGAKTELRLWEEGWTSWSLFEAGYSGSKRSLILPFLNLGDLLERLPKNEAWRLYPTLRDRTAFLDIETTGISGETTCIGLYDGKTARTFVRGRNLLDFAEAMEPYEMLVTFNGTQFDLPILERLFPSLGLQRRLHVDLRFALRRLGLRGGLKSIEGQLGLDRGSLRGIDGWSAVTLWQLHQRGHRGALPTLERYNLEDVLNLEPLICHLYNELAAAPPLCRERLVPLPRPEPEQLVDEELVDWLLARS